MEKRLTEEKSDCCGCRDPTRKTKQKHCWTSNYCCCKVVLIVNTRVRKTKTQKITKADENHTLNLMDG